MSNIHGLSSSSGDRNRPNNQFPMMGVNNDGGNPREESFGKFLKNFCCPQFSFLSVIFIISVIDLVIYIVTLSFGIKLNPNELLAPKTETLDLLGMKVKVVFTLESYKNKISRRSVETYHFQFPPC